MSVWLSAFTGPTTYTSRASSAEAQHGEATEKDFLLATESEPILAVSGATYLLALLPRAADPLRETLGALPEVQAILWSTVDTIIRIVSVLPDRTDDVILRVADAELKLMDKMDGFEFDFRTSGIERRQAFLAAGYVPLFEREDDDNSGPA